MFSCKKLIGISLIGLSLNANAGLWATTTHSRANCFNNESITWNANFEGDWKVVSFHNYDLKHPNKGYHVIDTGLGHTWRQAAVHWNESAPGGSYYVDGFHYFMDWGRILLDSNTNASNCSIYNGWWDR